MGTQEKSKYIHIRIESDLKNKFTNYCENNLTTPSIVIRDFIKKIILDNVKGK